MTGIVGCDVSEFQVPVNDSYPHRWLSFRVCDGSYVDRNAGANLAWSEHAVASGRMDGFTVYVVYRPGMNQVILSNLDHLAVPKTCAVMIDAESWGGQITGDHSAELDALANALHARQGGDPNLVWGYGNRGDIATLWSNRPSWLGFDVASYGGSQPAAPAGDHLIGWQYTDGQYAVAGLPSSSAPFGPCDHNIFYIEELMPLTDSDWARLTAIVNGAVVRLGEALVTGKGNSVVNSVDAPDVADGVGLKGHIAAVAEAPVQVDPNALAQAIASHVTLAAK